MFFLTICITLLLHSVSPRHVPRYTDLDEDEELLFRAAYDTPLYNQNNYDEENDLPLGKLDLVKDGLWAIKAKIKQLKAFDKALAANMLATKLKLKELLENHMQPTKKHKDLAEKKKPYYNYQPTQYYPQYDQQYVGPNYEAHQYAHDPYHGL